MNNDNFDIDNLLENDQIFKPLTDGLGFHHSIKEKKDIKIDLKKKQIQLKDDLEKRSRVLNQKEFNKEKKQSMSMGELAPFYAQDNEKDNDLDLNINPQDSVKPASLTSRTIAWGLDFLLVLTGATTIFISIILANDIPLSFIRSNLYNLDLLITVGTIFILFYSFYFSFFDKTLFSTPGKKIMGIKVVSVRGSQLTLGQSFNRVMITLCSLFSFGLGHILKLQDKLTDTMVIHK